MGSGQPVPSHVYDEIDTYISEKNWEAALEAIFNAIGAYQDKKLHKHNCLWLYNRGVHVAGEFGAPGFVISFLKAFIDYGGDIIGQGPHVKEVILRSSKIRPPRKQEIEQAKSLLAECERDYIESQTEINNRPQAEVEQEVMKFKSMYALKSGGCLVPIIVLAIGILLSTVAVGVLW